MPHAFRKFLIKENQEFLLTEDRKYLGEKVGDILNAIQNIQDNGQSIGARELNRNSEEIVDRIRGILHDTWSRKDKKFLKPLQKIGVAIMKALEEKGDLLGTISSSSDEVTKLLDDLGVPLNKLAGGQEKGAEEPQEVDAPQQMPQQPEMQPPQGMGMPGMQPQPMPGDPMGGQMPQPGMPMGQPMPPVGMPPPGQPMPGGPMPM